MLNIHNAFPFISKGAGLILSARKGEDAAPDEVRLFFFITAVIIAAAAVFALFLRRPEAGRKDGKRENTGAVSDYRSGYALIVLILIFTGAFMLIINTYTQIRSINAKMNGEANVYCSRARDWANENKTLIDMLALTFSAQPDIISDRDRCERILDDTAEAYEDISSVYIVNPEWEQPVIISGGRESNDSYRNIEERGWFIETMDSADENGFNISTPYPDMRTGLYCITFSRKVFDSDGNMIGVLGMDCCIDRLTCILNESYTEDSYAFLTDSSYNIISHPNKEYVMRGDISANAGGPYYGAAVSGGKAAVIRDYDGERKLCVMTKEQSGTFAVFFVRDLFVSGRSLIMSDANIIFLFAVCIAIVVSIMKNLELIHKQANEELRKAAEAATAASLEKDSFLANMSHEIRTPMNAVIGMTELILRENDISGKVRDYCCNIRNSGKNLLSIINDILDFSKIESGKLEITEDNFNIASTLNDVANISMMRIGKKPLKFITMVNPAIPSGLVGDELRIRQILINLMTNAVKYSREGCVILNVWQERYGDEGQDFVLGAVVTDTGMGIAPEDIDKMFDKFRQLDTKKNRGVEGTGLGLAITKRLIEQMGGYMEVNSTYGKGSEFKFHIPLKVSDNTPFLSVNDAESVHAALYADMSLYAIEDVRRYLKMTYEGLGEHLNIDLECYYSLDELKEHMKTKKYTHIIIGAAEYMSDKAFFEDTKGLIVVQKRDGSSIDIPNAKVIYEPLCAMSLTAALNDESSVYSESTEFVSRFIAPDAKVLIVDDSEVNLQVAEGLMKPYRMNITAVSSAAEAVKAVTNTRFDIIFMDHMMPEVDGVEATKLIRSMENSYFKNVPVIALTANAVIGVREELLAAGMNDFLAKPIGLFSLDRILKKWLPSSLVKPLSEDEMVRVAVPAEGKSAGSDIFSPETGLFYTGGSESAYLKVLGSYVRQYDAKSKLLSGLCEEKSWERYVTEVHALKSASLTIGARALSELAGEIELAGTKGVYREIEEKNEALLGLYSHVIEEAEIYLSLVKKESPRESEELPEASSEMLRSWTDGILEACDAYNAARIRELCAEAEGFVFGGEPLKPFFDDVLSAAGEFEFDDAAQKTKAICERLL